MSIRGRGKRLGRLFAAAAALLALGIFTQIQAAQERYDYDGLGRLIRRVDSQNRATDYVYDAAGNVVRVTGSGGTAQPPSITQIVPASLRRGDTAQITISGANLTGVAVTTDSPALDVRGLRTTSTQASFTLTVDAGASLGAHAIRLSSASGTTSATVAVAPVLPVVTVEPTPLAIPPDGSAHQVTLRLSNPDTVDHTVAIAASSAKIAVSPAQVTFAAGQTTTVITVTGITAGTANILMTSATLGVSGVPVYVTADFRGISTSYASLLGVVLEGATGSVERSVSPLVSRLLGIAVGDYIDGTSPAAFVVGGTGQLVVTGRGLNAATAVSVVPATGVSLGSPVAAPDGSSLAVPLTVAADAPLGPRQVVVLGAASKAFPAARPDADRFAIVRAGPQIDSIEPLFATRGTTVALTVRGRNLQDARFSLSPGLEMVAGNDPVVSQDGTQATVNVSVGLLAALGDYAIVATTAGGATSASPAANNRLRVVNEIHEAVTPITSLPLGVVLQDGSTPTRTLGAYSRVLGVAIGGVVTGVTPAAGIIGTRTTIVLQGAALHGVTAVQLSPATGVAAGAVTVAPDGKSATVELDIAADAPRAVRTLKVLAGAVEVPFSDPGATQFRVTAPLPAIASVVPNSIQAGLAPQQLVVTGANFTEASAVVVLPPDNLAISTPTVSGDGTQITVNIAADGGAAFGPRVVTVVTPAGQSSTAASPANTLTVGKTVTIGPSPVLSPLLGVKLLGGPEDTPPPTFLASPLLGLVLESGAPPATTERLVAARLGVALGSVTTGIDTAGFAPGAAATLTVFGSSLAAVDAVTVTPATGVVVGTPVPAQDGTSVAVPLTIASDASALIPRRVSLSAAGVAIPDARPAVMAIQIGPGVPYFDSISPILGNQGDKLTMTIRGNTLAGAYAVTAEPAEGIVFSNAVSVDAAGKVLTVDFQISPDAPLGSRVIRVWVPGAGSDPAAAPDNTFTVYAP